MVLSRGSDCASDFFFILGQNAVRLPAREEAYRSPNFAVVRGFIAERRGIRENVVDLPRASKQLPAEIDDLDKLGVLLENREEPVDLIDAHLQLLSLRFQVGDNIACSQLHLGQWHFRRIFPFVEN